MPRLGKAKANAKNKGGKTPKPLADKATEGASLPVSMKTLTEEDIAKLASKPNVQIIKNGTEGEGNPITDDELKAAYEEFRPLYLQLRQENPSWSEDEIRVYMYENDDAFMSFFEVTETCAQILTSDNFDKTSWDQLVTLQGKVVKKKLSIGEMVAKLLDSYKAEGETMRSFKEMVKEEYGGSVAMFMAGEKRDNEIRKQYTNTFLKTRQEQMQDYKNKVQQAQQAQNSTTPIA